jgi:hypothetical protein
MQHERHDKTRNNDSAMRAKPRTEARPGSGEQVDLVPDVECSRLPSGRRPARGDAQAPLYEGIGKLPEDGPRSHGRAEQRRADCLIIDEGDKRRPRRQAPLQLDAHDAAPESEESTTPGLAIPKNPLPAQPQTTVNRAT